MKKWQIVALVFGVWNLIGFICGAANTASERDEGHYIHNVQGGLDYISENHSGCIYRSISAFTNIGYVVGCEMYRKRFELEGFKK